jgi:DNA modification methylase
VTASNGRLLSHQRPARGAQPDQGDGTVQSPSEAGRSNIAPSIKALVVPIESVTLHPNNPRVGDVKAVAASLARFGQLKPVVVQESSGYVVAGNHVLRAARSLGWTELAVAIENLDDATATAFMLADNRTADLGGYDERLLAAILSDTAAASNLAGTGYDVDDVAALIAAAGLADERDADVCPAPPVPTDVYVRAGELWSLGAHRLLIGDSTDAADVERVTEGAPVDLLWTDPPYGVGYVGKTKAALRLANDDLGDVATRRLVADALTLAPLRPGGAFYLAAPAGPLHLAFLLALGDAGLAVHQTLVWVKDRFVLGHADYHARHEPILYGWRDGAAHHFVRDRTQDTVWEINRPSRSTDHPTMKPVALVERAIRNSSRPGDLVYDAFAGSGTTLIAAEIAGRCARVIEIDPAYAQVALERWATLTGRRPTLVERRDDRDG